MVTNYFPPAESAKQFLEQLLDVQGGWQLPNKPIFVWRGVGDADNHPLVPSALRPSSASRLFALAYLFPDSVYYQLNDDLKQAYLEFRIIERFLEIADKSGLSVPELSPAVREAFRHNASELRDRQFADILYGWPHFDLIPLISFAQHYGLPTRLLDWTYDVLTSAYFAAESALRENRGNSSNNVQNRYLAVWCVNPYDLEAAERRDPVTRQKLLKVEFGAPPRHQNPNLNAQSGLFSWMSGQQGLQLQIAQAPFDQTANSLMNESKPESGREVGSFMVSRLSWAHADELLTRLFNLGVSPAKLQPGYAGVAATMEQLSYLKWAPGSFKS